MKIWAARLNQDNTFSWEDARKVSDCEKEKNMSLEYKDY